MTLSLGAALYYDTDLSTNPKSLRALWEALTRNRPGELIQWTGTQRTVGAKEPLDIDSLTEAVASGELATAAIEAESGALLVLSHTTPAAKLPMPLVPRSWKYDTAIAISGDYLAQIGSDHAVDAIVAFADAVAVRAGVVFWADSVTFASGLATGGLTGSLRPEQERAVRDSHDLSNHWGRIIRGPAWGTFLGEAHVTRLGDVASLPATRVVRLSSGGAFVQLAPLDEATRVDEASPQLDQLREALATVTKP